MSKELLPDYCKSILKNPIAGLEIERWIRLSEHIAQLSSAPVVMINHAFERGVEVLK